MIGEYHNTWNALKNYRVAVLVVPPAPAFVTASTLVVPLGCSNLRELGGIRSPCCNLRMPGKDVCMECFDKQSPSKTSHYDLSEPISEPLPVNPLGQVVAGSVGIPYYKFKRQDEVDTDNKEKECRLCMEKEKYVIMQPCGCVCLCGNCAMKYSEKTCLNCHEGVSYLQGLRSV